MARPGAATVHEEAVVDPGERVDGVDVGDHAARGLRLTDGDEVLGLQPAEDDAGVVADPLPGLREDVVGVAVARVREPGVADGVASQRIGDFSASTPTFCADTPTHTAPSRTSSLWASIQSGPASAPPLTFNHSTMTVPLKRRGSIGRITTARVVYGAVLVRPTLNFPSAPNGADGWYALAVPERNTSDCS